MPLIAPVLNSLTAFPANNMISLDWTNKDTYTYIEVWRNASGGSYSLIKTYYDGSREAHDDYGRTSNITYGYKVRGCSDVAQSNYSNALTRTLWADTLTDTVTCTPSISESAETMLGDVTCTPTVTHACTINDTHTVTVTCTPLIQDAQSVSADYAYYVGRADGAVCLTSDDYAGDAGEVITATWTSKVTDFSDQFPDWADQYKCVYSVKLLYEDLEAIDVTMSISSDGGNTWTTNAKNIGSGDGKTKAKEFFFMKHGQYFQFKIVHASATTTFKFLGLEVEVEPTGEWYAI